MFKIPFLTQVIWFIFHVASKVPFFLQGMLRGHILLLRLNNKFYKTEYNIVPQIYFILKI